MMTNKRQITIITGFMVLLLILDVGILRMRRTSTVRAPSSSGRLYTVSELAAYNGIDASKPVLIGLDGEVFDVSSGRNDFYDPGKPYHFIAGTDASVPLHIAGASLIRKKYPIVGHYK